MGEEELRQEIQRAQAALDDGKDEQAVKQLFKERTGFESIEAAERDLQFRMQQPEAQDTPVATQDATRPFSQAEQRQAGVVDFLQQAGRDVVSTAAKIPDFLKVAGQELTGRFGDELVGQMARQGQTALINAQALTGQEMDPEAAVESVEAAQREGTESARESIAASRERIGPLGRGAALLAPAAIPYGVGARAIGAGTGLLGTMARGGATAAAEGGLFALGGAEGSPAERVAQVDPVMDIAVPGAAGGALSMILPRVANAVQRGRSGRGTRLADVIREGDESLQESMAGTTRRLGRPERSGGRTQVGVRGRQPEAVSAAFYKPLDREFAEIADEDLLTFLREGPEEVQRMTRGVSAEVASGERLPSFDEVQQIRRNLKRLNETPTHGGTLEGMVGELDERFQQAVPGLREADEAFATVMRQQDAFERGRAHWNKTADDLELAMEDITKRYTDDAGNVIDSSLLQAEQDEFRRGVMGEWLSRILERDESAGSVVNKIMDAGPGFRRIEETLLPPEVLRDFRRAVNEEQSAEAVRQVVRRWGRWFIPMLISGTAGYAIARGSGASGSSGGGN